MNYNPIDLSNCDREPIHIPGKVQSHGFMIAADITTLTITHVSENVSSFINTTANELISKFIGTLDQLQDLKDIAGQLGQLLKIGEAKNSFETINPYPLRIRAQEYYMIISIAGSNYLLEFEPVTMDYDIQNQLGRSVSAILSGRNLKQLLTNTAKEIKDIIHYDRVMVYKFLEDGHGEVVAEEKNEELESFYGLHYPASDIPKQARELYKLNYTRIIADVNTSSAALIGHVASGDHGQPLDLTHSVLRAVSPIHIQYLKNMGVDSSFSISLIAHGELWGLVACHNYSPKFIDYKAREASKLIGKIVSSALEYREDEEEDSKVNSYSRAIDQLNLYMTRDEELIAMLTKEEFTLQDVVGASGVAILMNSTLTTLGITPDNVQLHELFDWLKTTMHDSVYYTHRLPEVYHPAMDFKEVGSGMIAAMLSREMNEMIIWFKPEQITTVKWAGNPDKPAAMEEDGLLKLSPRNSFEVFSQIVEHTATKWTQTEVSNVIKIREKIISAIHKKAGEIRLLNERLKRAYDELDTFSYTISHDLRTPLTSIKSFTELVLFTNKSLDEQGRQLLGRVVAGADKMNFLINEILKLARVGRADLDMEQIDMKKLIGENVAEVVAALDAGRVNFTYGQLPDIIGSATMIGQVFMNIINNAVKYSAGSQEPAIHIEGNEEGDEVVYQIKDNGIGIDVDHHDKVYELFKRMNNAREIAGTGVGLAIVKRIIEKHNARIWFESELKVGTIFYIAFKK